MDLDIGYHNVGISLVTLVKKEEIKAQNREPEKMTSWKWVKWKEFVEFDRLFNPFHFFFE